LTLNEEILRSFEKSVRIYQSTRPDISKRLEPSVIHLQNKRKPCGIHRTCNTPVHTPPVRTHAHLRAFRHAAETNPYPVLASRRPKGTAAFVLNRFGKSSYILYTGSKTVFKLRTFYSFRLRTVL
jgi:hypothetical protein